MPDILERPTRRERINAVAAGKVGRLARDGLTDAQARRLAGLAMLLERTAPVTRTRYATTVTVPWLLIEEIRKEVERLG